MVYADYDYYKETFQGSLPEEDFIRLSRQASAYLDAITFNRAENAAGGNFGGKIKDACCAVVDAYNLNENGGGIAAETNDGISVNYIAGVSTAKTDDQRLYGAAALYLMNTGLMYRGCGNAGL